MMSEKRFSWETEKLQHSDDEVIMVVDNANKDWKGHILNIVNLLNNFAEQNEQLRKYNKQLKERLERINGGYGHLTHRNGLTANEWLIESQERELQKKNEQISDWIERHSHDIVKIGEQQATISDLKEENKQLQKKNKILEEDIDDYHNALFDLYKKYDKLETENEQLKNDINDCDFLLCQDDFGNYEIRYDDDKIFHFLWEVAPILNKQQAIIQSLREEVNKLNEELCYCEKFRYQVFQKLSELNGD